MNAHPDHHRLAAAPHGKWRYRLALRLFGRAIARIDAGMAEGRLTAMLPGGAVLTLGGRAPGPVAELHLHRWRGLARLLLAGSVGWYHAWCDGDWTSADEVAVFAVFSRNAVSLASIGRARGPARWWQYLRHRLHRNSRSGSRHNIAAHYDLGNSFYRQWLDPSLAYSSALFDSAQPAEALEVAQYRKIDAILERLNLLAGQSLLEIGCGWGALGARAVERFGVRYTGLTLSEEQAAFATPLLGAGGTIALRDYRDEQGQYDAIASVEMVEAVGEEYWPAFLDCIAGRLKPGGRAAIQYIAIDDRIYDGYAAGADFIQTYIFPGGCLLSEPRFRALAAARGLSWDDQANFPLDYAETLRRWRVAFDAAERDGRLPARFDAAFCRMWRFYLMYCEGGFRGGSIWVAQVTLTKAG